MMNKTNSEVNTKETYLSGLPGSPGIVFGDAALYQRKKPVISSANIADGYIDEQIEQFNKARELAKNELTSLLERQEDESAIDLIHTQLAILSDPDLFKKIEKKITEAKKYADSAIEMVFEEYLNVINEHEDDVVQQRIIDIEDVRDRLIQIVNNKHRVKNIPEGSIVVAHALSPREVIECVEKDIKGIVMDHGGTTSHAAIIARSMNIPAVFGLKDATDRIESGKKLVLDGEKGEIFINPSVSTLQEYQELAEKFEKNNLERESICEESNQTSDGHPFTLRANIEFSEELDIIKKYKAEGIGLVRTESVYLRHKKFRPRQGAFYHTVLKQTAPNPVTIRLLDTGGDKFLEHKNEEQNPFLGWRGIRMLLDEKALLREQLKAILKTSSKFKGRLKILVPMVSRIEEIVNVKQILQSVKNELKQEEISFDDDIPLGIMVEVPSVALQAEAFAKYVDFFSIGTNDLTQYILAVDRGNELISGLYDQRHPAVWQIIKQIAEAAAQTGTPLSVCGELASDPLAACCLLGLGIDELSMNPIAIPKVKKQLCSHSFSAMRQLSTDVLAAETMEDINQIFSDWK